VDARAETTPNTDVRSLPRYPRATTTPKYQPRATRTARLLLVSRVKPRAPDRARSPIAEQGREADLRVRPPPLTTPPCVTLPRFRSAANAATLRPPRGASRPPRQIAVDAALARDWGMAATGRWSASEPAPRFSFVVAPVCTGRDSALTNPGPRRARPAVPHLALCDTNRRRRDFFCSLLERSCGDRAFSHDWAYTSGCH
jgi:hypothetical protein